MQTQVFGDVDQEQLCALQRHGETPCLNLFPEAEPSCPALPSDAQTHLWGIILTGGDGKRLQPFVRTCFGNNRPKQYCTFFGDRSLLRQWSINRILCCRGAVGTFFLTPLFLKFALSFRPYTLVQERPRALWHDFRRQETTAPLSS